MKYSNVIIAIALLSLLCTNKIEAQESFLVVESSSATAAVFADTLYLGSANGEVFKLKTGEYLISLIQQKDIASWDAARIQERVSLSNGDTTRLELEFPNQYRFSSFPLGAKVTKADGNELLGITPFSLILEDGWEGEYQISKDGYHDHVSSDWSSKEINAILTLIDEDKSSRIDVFERQATPNSGRLLTASIVAVTAAAAAVSVHYKFKADRLYDQYVDITNPALRPEILKYDRYAGAALGVMQGGLVLLAVRLAF